MRREKNVVSGRNVKVVISSPLETELVDLVRAVDPRVRVLFEPKLLATPRYEGDHGGIFTPLSSEQSERWHHMLANAEVSFDFDRREPELVRQNFPALRWVQATSAGVGQLLPNFPLDLDRVTITTAAGVHAEPLSEFVLASLLYFTKGIPVLRRWQSERKWTRYTGDNLAGKHVLIVGLGHVGRSTASKLAAVNVEVTAAVRPGGTSQAPGVDKVINFDSVLDALPSVDALVLACPLTPQTEGLINADCFDAMKPGALLVNVARGQVVDETSMIAALATGRLAGAALDVATVEPLPGDSPLWDMNSVLISPHSASTVAGENRLITQLFCENLRRWLDDQPLINVYHPDRGY